MVLESQIKELFLELLRDRHLELEFMGSVIEVNLDEKRAAVSLSAPVYSGGNYIPPSVRACLRQSDPLRGPHLEVFPSLNEELFEVILNYQGALKSSEPESLALLIEEFGEAANEWKEWLDQHDKNDLVYVRPPST